MYKITFKKVNPILQVETIKTTCDYFYVDNTNNDYILLRKKGIAGTRYSKNDVLLEKVEKSVQDLTLYESDRVRVDKEGFAEIPLSMIEENYTFGGK